MSRQYLIPGWGYANEVAARQYFIPGQGYLNDTQPTQATGAATGTSTAAAVGASLYSASGAATGSGSAAATGSALAASVGSSSGTATAQATAVSNSGVGSAAGTGAAQAVGVSQAQAAAFAAGSSTNTGVGAATTTGTAAAAGTSTAAAASQFQTAPQNVSYLVPAWGAVNETVPRQFFIPGQGYLNATQRNGNTGTASGTASAQAIGAYGIAAVGTASGTSLAQAAGYFASSAQGLSQGSSTGAGVSASTAQAAAAAQGTSIATGRSSSSFFSAVFYTNLDDLFNYITVAASAAPDGTGLAIGTSNAAGVGGSLTAARGSATGTSTAASVGGALFRGTGAATGTSTSQGAGAFVDSGAPTSIGGIAVGSAGTGIYSGYTLSGGDDFDGSLSLVNPANPNGLYFTSRSGRPPATYGTTSKARCASLYASYAVDPYHTGHLDAGRGVVPAGWADSHVQSGGVLTLKQRVASVAEKALFDGAFTPQDLNAAIINTAGLIVAQPPCVIEARVRIPDLSIFSGAYATNGAGFHFTMWTLQCGPIAESNNWEQDFEVYNHKAYNLNWNKWTGGIDGLSGSAGSNVALDTAWHTLTFEILPGTSNWYFDGTLVGTKVIDATFFGNKPFYLNLTNQTFNDTYNLAPWTALGNAGLLVNIDWIRVWRDSTASHRTALVSQSSQNVDFNTAFSITLPNAATVWGDAALTDTLEMVQHEAIAPSGQGQESRTTFMPAGVTYTGGVLSGTVSDRPGTIYFLRYGTKVGESCVPQRFALFVGPTITTLTLHAAVGVPYSYDLYTDCQCGELLPKTITCTGLPPGISFDAATGLITGTPTGLGTTTAMIGVTNSKGQSASVSVSFVVTSVANNLVVDGSVSSFTFTSGAVTATLSTTKTNDIIVVFAAGINGSSTSSVTSITDTAGLTWAKRTGVNHASCFELWWAYSAGILTNDVITVNFANATTGRVTAFGVNGVTAANYSAPFDTNAAVPATTYSSGTANTQTISTTATNTLVISAIRGSAGIGTVTRPGGFTQVVAAGTTEDVSYAIETSPLSGTGVTYGWGTNGTYIMITDAIRQ